MVHPIKLLPLLLTMRIPARGLPFVQVNVPPLNRAFPNQLGPNSISTALPLPSGSSVSAKCDPTDVNVSKPPDSVPSRSAGFGERGRSGCPAIFLGTGGDVVNEQLSTI